MNCYIVFIAKCPRKRLLQGIREYLGEVFHDLGRQREHEFMERKLLLETRQHDLLRIALRH